MQFGDVISGIDPCPSQARLWIKYLQVLEPNKREISRRKRQNIVEAEAEICFSPQNILRLGAHPRQLDNVHAC